jgi:hypothetical protein
VKDSASNAHVHEFINDLVHVHGPQVHVLYRLFMAAMKIKQEDVEKQLKRQQMSMLLGIGPRHVNFV